MTETTLTPTTERVVDLARLYFEDLGATVRRADANLVVEFDGVTPPSWAASHVDDGRLVATPTDESDDRAGDERDDSGVRAGDERDDSGGEAPEPSVSDDTTATSDRERPKGGPEIGPETAFARRLIDAAAARCPVGTASVTGVPGGADSLVPAWLRDSPVDVASVAFHPYYDSQVVCAWVRVEIETPSQYQRESLHTVVVDPESGTRVDCDPTALVDAAAEPASDAADAAAGTASDAANATADSETLRRAIDEARDHVVADVDDTLADVETAASRAATDAFQQYATRQRDRLSELRADRDRIETELASISDRLGDAAGDERVELLERRERLTERRAALDTDLSALRTAASNGFPDHRARLRQRHAVELRTRPVAVTSLSVERGDLSVTVRADGRRETLDLSVGALTGLRRTATCPRCDRAFGQANGLRVADDGVACEGCVE